MNRLSVAEIAKRIASLISMNEISPFTFEWWLYTVALLSVALPAAILAVRYQRSRWRDPRFFAVTSLLLTVCFARSAAGLARNPFTPQSAGVETRPFPAGDLHSWMRKRTSLPRTCTIVCPKNHPSQYFLDERK